MSEGVWSNSRKWGDGTLFDSRLTQPAPGGDYPGGVVGRVEGQIWKISWSGTWSGYLDLFLFKGVVQTGLVELIYHKKKKKVPHCY